MKKKKTKQNKKKQKNNQNNKILWYNINNREYSYINVNTTLRSFANVAACRVVSNPIWCGMVQWSKLPAWKVRDRGLEPRSGIQVLKN